MTRNTFNHPFMWDTLLSQSDYLADLNPMTKDRVLTVIKWVDLTDKTIVNLGSGQGYLEDVIPPDGSLKMWISADISHKGLLSIKSRHENNQVIQMSASNTALKAKSVDVLIFMEVMEHIPKYQVTKVLAEISRVLTDDGLLVLSVPLYETTPLKNHPVGHLRKYTRDLIERELVENGFTVIKMKTLYSFNRFYNLKSFLANLLGIRRPNLFVSLCRKS